MTDDWVTRGTDGGGLRFNADTAAPSCPKRTDRFALLWNEQVVMPVIRRSTVHHMRVRCECGDLRYGYVPAFVRTRLYRPGDTIIVVIVHRSSS